MKLNKIFIAALAATTLFASCAKENPSDTNTGTQTIMVKLPGNVAVRGVETPVANQFETPLNATEIRVFLLNGNNVVKTDKFVSGEIAGGKLFEQAPASINRVIVVANYGSAYETDFAAMTTASQIQNFAFTIASQNTGTGVNNSKTLIGDGTPVVNTTSPLKPADAHTYKEVTIELKAITARIEVGDVKPGANLDEVELLGVWINNYYINGSKPTPVLTGDGSNGFHSETNPVWQTSPAVTSALSLTPYAKPTIPAYTHTNYFTDGSASVNLTGTDVKAYAYHVFSGNVPHLILLVRGKYTTPDEDGKQYFIGYVTFNKFLDDSSNEITAFEGNQIYKIGVSTEGTSNSGGITIDGKDITPVPETSKFDLGVKVTVAPWTAVNVTPQVQ